jgi:hypothetical protein
MTSLTARASVAGWPGATLAEGQGSLTGCPFIARVVPGQPTAACALLGYQTKPAVVFSPYRKLLFAEAQCS